MTRAQAQAIGDAAVLAQVQRATGGGYVERAGSVVGAPMNRPGSIAALMTTPVLPISAAQPSSVAGSGAVDYATPLPPLIEYGETKADDSSGEGRMAGEDGRRTTRQIGWDENLIRKPKAKGKKAKGKKARGGAAPKKAKGKTTLVVTYGAPKKARKKSPRKKAKR